MSRKDYSSDETSMASTESDEETGSSVEIGSGAEDHDEVASLQSVGSESEELKPLVVTGQKRMLEEEETELQLKLLEHSPLKRIFSHALLQGIPLPDQSSSAWQALGGSARTIPRTTPRGVLDAVDRDLRSADDRHPATNKAKGIRGDGTLGSEAANSANKDRAWRPFSPEEDTILVNTVRLCQGQGRRVPWNALDAQFGRYMGACRQRWKSRTVARLAVAAGIASAKGGEDGSGGQTAWEWYQQHRQNNTAAGDKAGAALGAAREDENIEVGAGGDDTEVRRQVDRVLADTLAAVEAVAVSVTAEPQGQVQGQVAAATSGSGGMSAAAVAAAVAATGASRAFKPVRNFTPEEDAAILQLVSAQPGGRVTGAQWAALDARLDRSFNSCRSRWVRVLAPREKQGQGQETKRSGPEHEGSTSQLWALYLSTWQQQRQGGRGSEGTEGTAGSGEVAEVLSHAVAAVEAGQSGLHRPAPPVAPLSIPQVRSRSHPLLPTSQKGLQQTEGQGQGRGQGQPQSQSRWSLIAPPRSPLQRYSAIADALFLRTVGGQQQGEEQGEGRGRVEGQLREVRLVLASVVQVLVEHGSTGAVRVTADGAFSSAPGQTAGPPRRVMRFFTAEEDELVQKQVQAFLDSGKAVVWATIDRALNRSQGAAQQRWQRVLGPKLGITV